MLVVEANSNDWTKLIAQQVPGRCLIMPLGKSGGFVGAGPRSCKLPMPQAEADGLYRYQPSGWVLQPLAETAAHLITAMATTDSGPQLAIALQPTSPTAHGARLLIFQDGPDGKSIAFDLPVLPLSAIRHHGSIDARLEYHPGGIENLAFSQDGASLWFRYGEGDYRYSPATGLQRIDIAGTGGGRIEEIGGRAVLIDSQAFGPGKAALRTGPTTLTAPIPIDAVQRIGQIAGHPLIWTATKDGTLRWWDSRSGAPVMTQYSFSNNDHFAVAPDGRYATSLSADSGVLRWIVPDEPTQALPIETFMRQLYEPQLVEKLLACITDGCGASLPPPPDLGRINRARPQTRIIDATPDKRDSDYVIVRVALTPVRDRAGNISGLHDLRLFQDGKIVAHYPDRDLDGDETLAQWREATEIAIPEDGGETIVSLRIPQLAFGARPEFSAYAFNSDRVKGETARRRFDIANPPDRSRRAVVVTIGIDTTANPAWTLAYAASDATAMADALQAALTPPPSGRRSGACTTPDCSGQAESPEYDYVDVITLISTAARPIATGATIRDVFKALAGRLSRAQVRSLARRIGVSPDVLDALDPEDALIITYSGHGDTVAGQFRLLPGDAAADAAGRPRLETLLSATVLSNLLSRIAARNMVLIIDACHSAASVDDGQFKPGPMGDTGLGQLAFDKGIRILAASQADAVALEFGSIGHGLLSYALFHDSLGGAVADIDGDGNVRMEEWLSWSANRVPFLAAEQAGRAASPPPDWRPGLIDEGAPPPRRAIVQQPALFDFTGHHGPILQPR